MKALQAVQDNCQDNVIEIESAGHVHRQKPEAPINLKDMADYVEPTYKTLRSNWIVYIEEAHEGLQCMPIREKKMLTSFGIDAVLEVSVYFR